VYFRDSTRRGKLTLSRRPQRLHTVVWSCLTVQVRTVNVWIVPQACAPFSGTIKVWVSRTRSRRALPTRCEAKSAGRKT
jgi:hypothetical protein